MYTYLLIAVVTTTYSPTGTNVKVPITGQTLELVDSITNRNECLHLAYSFRKEEAFKGVTFKCVRSTVSVEAE